MNEHLSYEEKLKLGISYIDDELLIEAFDTDTREKLRKHCFSRKLFQKSIKALAACACFVLVIGGLMLGILLGLTSPSLPPEPPIIDNEPPNSDLPPNGDQTEEENKPSNPVNPDEGNTPNKPDNPLKPPISETVVIDSIDKLNYYSALSVIENGGKAVTVSLPTMSLGYKEGQEYYFSPVDPNAKFTVTKVIFFRITLLDEYGFLANKVGKGEVDVVFTENSLENMITFKGEKGWYTCLENGGGDMVYVDGTPGWWREFSTHKYIEGFHLVKNTGVGNYKFRIIGNTEDVTNMSCQKFNPTGDKVKWEHIPDIIKVASGSTVTINQTYSFTITELETVLRRKEEEA